MGPEATAGKPRTLLPFRSHETAPVGPEDLGYRPRGMTLKRLGPTATGDDVAASLDEHGYALVEGLLPAEDVAAKLAALDGLFATTPTGRNAFEGFHTQRIYAVFAKTRAFDGI